MEVRETMELREVKNTSYWLYLKGVQIVENVWRGSKMSGQKLSLGGDSLWLG